MPLSRSLYVRRGFTESLEFRLGGGKIALDEFLDELDEFKEDIINQISKGILETLENTQQSAREEVVVDTGAAKRSIIISHKDAKPENDVDLTVEECFDLNPDFEIVQDLAEGYERRGLSGSIWCLAKYGFDIENGLGAHFKVGPRPFMEPAVRKHFSKFVNYMKRQGQV